MYLAVSTVSTVSTVTNVPRDLIGNAQQRTATQKQRRSRYKGGTKAHVHATHTPCQKRLSIEVEGLRGEGYILRFMSSGGCGCVCVCIYIYVCICVYVYEGDFDVSYILLKGGEIIWGYRINRMNR